MESIVREELFQTAMILHYFGITTDTPDEMMRKVFTPTEEEISSYTEGQKELVSKAYADGNVFEAIEYMQKFAKEFYTVESEVRYWKTFKEIKNDILAGFPALVSVGLLHEFDESFYKEDLESGKGPFRHAGISLSSTTVGRICLWY